MNKEAEMIYKIDLENKGQDFSKFFVEDGRIIHIEPSHDGAAGWAWRGKVLSAAHFSPGDGLSLKDGCRLSYKAVAVSIIKPGCPYIEWLAMVDKIAVGIFDSGSYTDHTGANKPGDPWIGLYLGELTPKAALLAAKVPELA